MKTWLSRDFVDSGGYDIHICDEKPVIKHGYYNQGLFSGKRVEIESKNAYARNAIPELEPGQCVEIEPIKVKE